MIKTFAALLALLTGASIASPAVAKTASATSVSTWIGSWTCTAGKDTYTETFTPMLNGKAMRVSVSGPYASEGIAVYDKTRKAWFYAFINGDSSYAANNGPVSGANIAFKQVFPPGFAVDTIVMNSPSKYTSSFTMVANHKKVAAVEVCTKT
ncbi:MAG TPA: hypothetical protein VFW34_00150 [Candidatus Rubrimentiphilum sp.]|nr:hypothetical protein [Candidatus Rubrimentiphilum sp.]